MLRFRESKSSVGRSWVLPSAIVVLGVALRLYRLDHQSVWYDEIFSLTVSHQSFHEMMQYLVKDFVQPPLHYFLLHVWFELVGFGSYQARLLSVIFGGLAILGTYLLGDYLFGRRAASIAALLLAMSQLAVMYSQEARPYAQLLFLMPFVSYLFLVALRTGSARAWWGFVCLVVLVIYTHFYGFFAVASLLLFAVVYRKRYRVPVSRWIGGAALAFVLYLPWLSSGMVSQWVDSSKLTHGPTRAHLQWWAILSALNSFNNGKIAGVLESSPWWSFALGGVFFGLPALIALTGLARRSVTDGAEQLDRENLILLVVLFAIPFSAGLAVGFLTGAYDIRYVTFVLVPYYLIVARGISMLSHAGLRSTLLVLALGYSGYSLRTNYVVPYKEDYRGAYTYLSQSREDGDCFVVAPTYEERQAVWAWAIYHGSQPPLALTPLDEVVSGKDRCSRVWLISILYRSTPPAVKQSKEAQGLLQQGHTQAEARHYFSIELDLYVPKSP